MADDPKEPYGDVTYADPGYQDDGKKRYPLDSEEHCRAAWSYINMSKNVAKYSADQLKRIKARIMASGKRYDIEFAESARSSAALTYDRTFVLDDIQIMRSGDGRTVEAYAAMFDAPYEVRDQHGHYLERIDRSAFNRTLTGGAGQRAICVYNHGMSLHGTPDAMASVPLGTPLEIRPDGRGLLTVTRYNRGPFADQVLEAIRNGDIKAQSFRGRIVRSDPSGPVPKRRTGPLPTVTRHELGLSDYGPTPTPVNQGAEILAIRSAEDLYEALDSLPDEERAEILRTYLASTPDEDPDDDDLDEVTEPATPDQSGPGAEDPPATRSEAGHSGRLLLARRALEAGRICANTR
jgi:HK97 family phage prohead protease